MVKILTVMLWVLFAALCISVVVGCFQPNQPDIGPPAPYNPVAQLRESVQGTNWLVTVSILATALSVAALFNGSKAALGALIGSITSLTVSLMVARYATLIAFIGLIFAVGVLVYSMAVKNKALFEIFYTAEKAKEKLTTEAELEVFTGAGSLADTIQSPTTRKVVDKLQLKLK